MRIHMKKRLTIFVALIFMLSVNISAQNYPEYSIMDIQYQHPDSLLSIGDKPSPLLGDTITVTGIVMNPSFTNGGTTLISGAPAVYLQDTTETDYAGVLVRFPNGSSPAFDALDSGTVAKFTGVVTEYNVTTQVDLIEFDGSTIFDFKPRPQPVLITLDSLNIPGSPEGNILAEKWEGVYVEVRNVTVGSNSIGSGAFSVFDGNNTEVNVGNQSAYFRNATPPLPGTQLEYVKGYIQNRTNFGGLSNMMIIMPVDSVDVKIAQFPPVISSISRDPALVGFGESVTVSANISDPDGTVSEAKLFWRKNSGTVNEINLINTAGSVYEGIIPAQNDSCVIDFFLKAVDNQNNSSTNPTDTSRNRYFYLVLDRPLTIQDVQYSPFGSGFSAYNNYEVTVTGIVTSDTSDIPLGPQVIIQNGTGPWSGIRINGTETLLLNKGDLVTVTGTVIENFSVTNITNINSSSQLTVVSTGNPLPVPETLSTSSIGTLTNGTLSAEQWESVLINYSNVTITDENADGGPGPNVTGNSNFGEIYVADASQVNTRVELQDGNNSYHNFWAPELEFEPIRVLVGDSIEELIGILYYSFGNYKLIPRTDADFVNYVTDVQDDISAPFEYKLTQNYPNPFNPSTKIDYSLKEAGFVSLKVYNILGQLVGTIVNQYQNAGNYSVNFDANKLSSGIYLYKIDSNGFTQTRKMMLVK
jgi:hypothetical protein